MAAVPAVARDAFSTDLCTAQVASCTAVVPTCTTTQDNAWNLWEDFCLECSIDPLLNTIQDPVHYLMVFALHYHDDCIAANGAPIRSQTAEDVLHATSQMMASLGSTDHQLIGPRIL